MSRSPRWDDYALSPLSELTERLLELTQRDFVARHIAARVADGAYDPARHAASTDYPPLTLSEHLEVLALGEAIARAVRHPSYVHHAVQAGIPWTSISTALGITPDGARSAYREWADGQRRLHTITSLDGRTPIGLSESEYADACVAAERVEDEGAK